MAEKLLNNGQLVWACRRGMLELDLLLLPFVEQVYPILSITQQSTFCRLLTFTDQDLFALLVGSQQHDEPLVNGMISLMRHFNTNS
jgi:antitoxin CptB